MLILRTAKCSMKSSAMVICMKLKIVTVETLWFMSTCILGGYEK